MKKTIRNEPINSFLENNIEKKPVSFHMPGHKYGRFPYKKNTGGFDAFDITEIPGADNIKTAKGIIKKSLELISEIYGSDRSYYLTNGSTSGVLAVMKYFSELDGPVLVSRDCHSSVVSGALLFNVPIGFIKTGYCGTTPRPVDVDSVRQALERYPDAKAMIITSPNYYGYCADVSRIGSLLNEMGILLAVDEAHGAHFRFNGMNGMSAVNNGADIVCHSLHKTLPVYNQGALLHVIGSRIDHEMIGNIIGMLGTTSPSYPVLASMEKAVIYYEREGKQLYEKLREEILLLGDKLSKRGCKLRSNDDFTRLVIDAGALNATGFETFDSLSEAGIYMETCDFENLVGISTPSNNSKDFNRLAFHLAGFEGKGRGKGIIPFSSLPEKVYEIHTALKMNKVQISLDSAEGSICGTMIIPYPPGIPCLYPGEKITGQSALYIESVLNGGGTVLGLEEGMIAVLELA